MHSKMIAVKAFLDGIGYYCSFLYEVLWLMMYFDKEDLFQNARGVHYARVHMIDFVSLMSSVTVCLAIPTQSEPGSNNSHSLPQHSIRSVQFTLSIILLPRYDFVLYSCND